MGHPLGDLVDCAITAGPDNEVSAPREVFAGDPTRRPGSRGGGNRHIEPLFPENFNCPLDQRAATPPELPRDWIVDQNGVFLGWDVNSPKFLVKL
jgi:hypothetical protein